MIGLNALLEGAKQKAVPIIVVIGVLCIVGYLLFGRTSQPELVAEEKPSEEKQQQMANIAPGGLDDLDISANGMRAETADGSVYYEEMLEVSTRSEQGTLDIVSAVDNRPKTATSTKGMSSSDHDPKLANPVNQLIGVMKAGGNGTYVVRRQGEWSSRDENPFLKGEGEGGRPFLLGSNLRELREAYRYRGQELTGSPPSTPIKVSVELPTIEPGTLQLRHLQVGAPEAEEEGILDPIDSVE